MKEFGLQLYSVRDHMDTEEGVKETFIKLKEMGYSTAQTAGTYDFIAPERFAEYAKDAIFALGGSVISGDENGNFNPEAKTTRAEAAQMIYKLLQSN